MYGLWLFKEIETEFGKCKVEIYRRGYNGSQIEIGALAANSLTISLENLSTITDPIGKSVCSFSIIDTEQIAYDDFFTPDATAYKVVVSTKVGEGAYVIRWSGYVTPDFFAENLSYRTPISISARDNIGYLNDVDFDLPNSTITVRELIQSAFTKIAADYPMSVEFVSQKQTAEGVLAIDATISTALLREMSWYEAVEIILHDLGLQMRWVDNNTIAVIDLSQIPEYYATQGFNFISGSGYREILPAWRQLSQEQNYGAFDNFYRGQIDGADKLEYAANSEISSNILLYQPAAKTQWERVGEIYFLNFFNSYNQYIDDNKAESIYVTGIAPTATNAEVLATKMVYSQEVTQVNKQIGIKFNLNDTLRTPLSSLYTRGEYNVFYLPYSTQTGGASGGVSQIKTPRPYQLKYRFNIFLRCNDGSNYVMREDWVDADTVNTEQPFIEFTTEKLKTANTNISDAQGNKKFAYTGYNNDEEYSITINSVPKAGTLEFVVYPWTFEEDSYTRETNAYQRGAKISDIQFTVKLNTTGIISGTLVGANHNIKNTIDYQFGEVPKFDGDLIAYAGGLFYGDTLTAINGFQRNADSTNYNLLELVGREVIHFNKKNYNKLSGTIKNLDKEPLMFNRLFVREGKKYAPYNYSLNVISNEMSITTMQEVEPYETASFTQIESEITTGGATVGGGNNTVLQYSEDAGNAKRVFELNAANADEKEDAYLIIDNANFSEAKKVHISEVKDNELRKRVEVLEDLGFTLKTYEVDGKIKNYVESAYDFYSKGGVSSGGVGGQGGGGGTGGVTALSALSDVALGILSDGQALVWDTTQLKWVNKNISGGTADSIAWDAITGKPSFVYYDTRIDTNTLANSVAKMGYGYATEGWYESGPALSFGVENYQFQMQMRLSAETSSVVWRPVQSGTKFTWRHFLDAFNYSSYALPLSGGTMSGSVTFPTNTYNYIGQLALIVMSSAPSTLQLRTTSSDIMSAISFHKSTAWYGTLTADTDSNLRWNDNTLIHSGNIGSYNAGSASKLQTARSVFGSSFDGTGDIGKTFGVQRIGDGAYAFYIENVSGTNGYDIKAVGGDSYIAFKTLKGGGSITEAMRITREQNILIGTTTDWGYKLGVNGATFITGNGDHGILIGAGSNTIDAWRVGGNSTDLFLNWQSSGHIKMVTGGGNVLIGTTSDNGAKLQVAGNFYATGGVTAGSDARYKTRIKDVSVDIETIAKAPLFVYKWADREDDKLHLGTTAQYWYDTDFKNAVVPTNDEKLWTMSYGEIAMGNTIVLAREQLKVKSRVEVLEDRVKELETELNKYRRA